MIWIIAEGVMSMLQPRLEAGSPAHRVGRMGRFLLVATVISTVIAPVLAEDEPEVFKPKPPMPEKFDWVQTTSGEWIKGELIEMYDEKLQFDSKEFDEVTIDWVDVQQIRTAGTMQMGFTHNVVAIGQLFLDGDTVRVIDEEGERDYKRSELITVAAGAPKEINYWSFKAMFGLNVSRGNTNVAESTIDVRVVRRTVKNRINLDYLARYNETEGDEVANNHRATLGWNMYISDRLYVSPARFEWFRDPFQNINHRETLGAGVGYELVDSPRIAWDVTGGPGYQRTTFDSVEDGTENPEDTPAVLVGTTLDVDLTKWMELFYEYHIQLVDEEAGQYNHHMLASLETDITSLLDFDVTLVWDRIQNPRQNEDGLTPLQDDFRLTVGLTFDW
jgi:putative salt-induced outer membrane protein YdiY